MAATKVRYVGAHAAVRVPAPDGSEAHVEQGQIFNTTSDHAAALLEQPANWEPVKPSKKEADEAAKGGE